MSMIGEQPLEIGLGDVIYTSKTSPEFSIHLLVKDLFMFIERDLHFLNLLFSSDESVWGKKKKGESKGTQTRRRQIQSDLFQGLQLQMKHFGLS